MTEDDRVTDATGRLFLRRPTNEFEPTSSALVIAPGRATLRLDAVEVDAIEVDEAEVDEAEVDEIVALTDLETNVTPMTDAAMAEEVAASARATKPAGAPVSLIEMLATGFDAIFENPEFAGADTSYWIRQAVPLIGGGRVALSGRNGILNSMRSSKEQGQWNFTNPGIWLIGLGVDLDLTPKWRLSVNANHLRFDETEVLEAARNQGPVDEEIGQDVSVSLTYRPFMTQNIVVRGSYAKLIAGDGFKDLFPDEDADYLFLNVLLMF